MAKYCCRKFKRFDKKYGGIVLIVDTGASKSGYFGSVAKFKEFREIWDLKRCIFCGKEIKGDEGN